MLVRTWNLHLGKAATDGKGGHLREMVELAVAVRPAFVCLQDRPASALGKLGGWAGMQVVAVRTVKRLGAGKGNAILLTNEVKIREEKQITLNTNPFCEEQAA